MVRCLGIKKGQPLVISAPVEGINFIRILSSKALELGVTDIYYDWYDDFLKHDQLINFSFDDISGSRFWNKSVYDEYANKDAAFLMFVSEDPDLMEDVDSKKIEVASKVNVSSRPIYKKRQLTNEIAWCIASISTYGWASKIFKSDDCVDKLWDLIFDICYINDDDPILSWNKNLISSSIYSSKLNDLNLRELHYTNGLGTDLVVGLSCNTIWYGAGEKMPDDTPIICNMPTFEIFTTPNRLMTNGVVFNSKPLVYNGSIIDDFWIEFHDGMVVNFDAGSGRDVLEGIIKGDANSCYLGEVALVNYDSPISNSGIIFYTTLLDENASCHLALGAGFPNSLSDTHGKSVDELINMGINMSDVHVDFMIGTSDLKISGVTYDGTEVLIFENGNFVLDV